MELHTAVLGTATWLELASDVISSGSGFMVPGLAFPWCASLLILRFRSLDLLSVGVGRFAPVCVAPMASAQTTNPKLPPAACGCICWLRYRIVASFRFSGCQAGTRSGSFGNRKMG